MTEPVDILKVNGLLLSHPEQFGEVVEQYASRVHLVAPATAVAALPWGCVVTCSLIRVDPDPAGFDVYPSDNGRVLLRSWTLDRIAASLAVSWSDVASRRVDDQSHAHFCAYRVVGHYRAFDGSWIKVIGDRVVDLRDKSHEERQIRVREGRNWRSALERSRAFINETTQTKARGRALRSVGVRVSYRPEELAKPFLVCRTSFLGRPANEADGQPTEANKLAMQAAITLWTGGPPRLQTVDRTPGYRLPPVGALPPDPDDDDPQVPPAPAPSQAQAQQDAASAPAVRPQPPPDRPAPPRGVSGQPGTCRFGGPSMVGQPLSDLPAAELAWYRDKCRERVETHHREEDQAHLAEVMSEIKRRQDIARMKS